MSLSPLKRVQGSSPDPQSPPARFSPKVMSRNSPFTRTLRACLPQGSTVIHAPACNNANKDVLSLYALPHTPFPSVRGEIGCSDQCYVLLAPNTSRETPVLAPAPRPGNFQTALATIFGDVSVNSVDTTALAYLAAMASSYEPSPDPNGRVQAPDSQPTQLEAPFFSSPPTNPAAPSSALIPYVPESSVPELPMDLRDGKNTESTWLGDSQHAHTGKNNGANKGTPTGTPTTSRTTHPTSGTSSSSRIGPKPTNPQKAVRFLSPLAGILGRSQKMIPDTCSGDSSQTSSTGDHPQRPGPLNLAQLLEEEGATPENTGLSLKELNGMDSKKDLIDFMAVLEESIGKKMEEMEERILQAIHSKPPKTHSHGPSNQRQPPTQPQRQVPVPIAPKTAPIPPQRTPTNATPQTPKTAQAVKQTWAAISATGIDIEGFKLVPTRKRKTINGPGIGQTQAPSTPSTPHARQRRLIIRSIEKNRRIGAAGCSPAHMGDAVNRASRVKFAFAEYNRDEGLVLTTVEDVPASPIHQDEEAITRALNDMDIYSFSIVADTPTINLVINSVPLGDEDWEPSDWGVDSERWSELEGELTNFNPHIRLMDRPKWIKSPTALKADNKERSSIIVLVEINQWIKDQTQKREPTLALYGLRCIFRKYIPKDSSTHCERCLQYGHHAAHCRLQAICKFCQDHHHTKDHTCQQMYCTAGKDKTCSHIVRKCANCEETSHFTGDRHCPTRTRARSPTTAEKGKAPAEPANPNPHD